MIHWCKNCPGIELVEQFLYYYMRQIGVQDAEENENSDDFDEVKIDFKQWATMNQINLTSIKLLFREFIDLLCEKIDKITHTHLLYGYNQVTWHILKEQLGLMRHFLGRFC